MRLTLTFALLAFSFISFVFAHPLVTSEPDARASELELAERDVDHVQWLERRLTEEERRERDRKHWRDYQQRKTAAHMALSVKAAQGDPQAQAEYAAAEEAKRTRARQAKQRNRDKKKASGLLALSQGSERSSSSGSQAAGQGGSSGHRSTSLSQGGMDLPPIQQTRPQVQSQQLPPLSEVIRQSGYSQGGSYGGQYQGSSQFHGYQSGRSSGR
ncbi:hypothetical protein K474DRAFT_1703500 [Panus rudis PR-1116 ss-1]|nr:hypothetical protein K474DRAFT_1703500 [Panus rudis PR-1116 ss-1]